MRSLDCLHHLGWQFVVKIVVLFVITYFKTCFLQLFEQNTTYFESIQCSLEDIIENSVFLMFLWYFRRLSYLFQAMQRRIGTTCFPHHIFAHIACLFLTYLPTISLHIVEIDVLARIGNIATNSIRIKQTLMYLYVLESNIFNSDSRLGRAGALFIERIEHAAWPISIRFFHLLRADINCPPDRSIHGKITVVDVLDQSCSFISWICFHIDSFKRSHHSNISKCDIFNAIAFFIRWDTADSHANTQEDSTILDQKITSTVTRSYWFGHHDIIIILTGNVIDMESCS